MYDTTHELLQAILAGEDSLLDFKEVVVQGSKFRLPGKGAGFSQETAKDLCCFANSDGGVIVYGVRDDNERIGIPEDRVDELIQLVANVARDSVEPAVDHLLVFDKVLLPDSSGTNRLCLKVEIKRARYTVHAPKGRRPYHRVGAQCHEMSLAYMAQVLERRSLLKPYEERPQLQANFTDLEAHRFSAFFRAHFREEPPASDDALRRHLRNLFLVSPDELDVDRPTTLGILLLTSHPERWVRGAWTDLVTYSGVTPTSDDQLDAREVYGTIPEQIEELVEYLARSPNLAVTASKDGHGRLDRPVYSLLALQEALVNALAHRDYGIQGSQTRVLIFRDRIEVWSPGRLPNSLTPDNLFAGCQPIRRNPQLAGLLRHHKSERTNRSFMEARGEGFLSIVRECRALGAPHPVLEVPGDAVKLTIFPSASSDEEAD